jgi:hypothetical protein
MNNPLRLLSAIGTPVSRERPADAEPRGLRLGDVVRHRTIPLVIERVVRFDGDAAALVFESGSRCLLREMAATYEHADGAPIDGVGS